MRPSDAKDPGTTGHQELSSLDCLHRDLLRLPSLARSPVRQHVRIAISDDSWEGEGVQLQDVWVKRDDDFDGAFAVTPLVFLGGLADDNVVSIPWVHVRMELAGVLAADLSVRAQAIIERWSLPLPHYRIVDGTSLTLLWRIDPFSKPKKSGLEEHKTWFNRGRTWWSITQHKLSLAFAELGAIAKRSYFLDVVPLPPRTQHSPSSAVLVDASPASPTLRVKAISSQLEHLTDAAMAVVTPHARRGRHTGDGWTKSPRFIDANQPKTTGWRHPAAVTQACILRWAGWVESDALAHLVEWVSTNTDKSGFPEVRSNYDEVSAIVAWAWRRLKPGGPTARDGTRGKYSDRDDVIGAVVAFLMRAGAMTSSWVGTMRDLATLATLQAAEHAQPGEVAPIVTCSTLEKLLRVLRADHGVVTRRERSGQTWTTAWRLVPPQRPAQLRLVPSDGDPPFLRANPPDQGRAAENPISEHQSSMSIGGPRPPSSSPSFTNRGVQGGLPLVPVLAGLPGSLARASALLPGPQNGPILPAAAETAGAFATGKRPILPAAAEAAATEATTSRPDGAPDKDAPPVFDPPWPTERIGQAVLLWEMGASQILLKPSSKEPIAERWMPAQSRRAGPVDLARQLGEHPDANLGIVCGAISRLVVIDLDSEDAVIWALQQLPPTPLRTRTSRGEHWWFLHPGRGIRVSNGRPLRGVEADVKGDGGYVVAPGSRHPSGAIYEPIGPWCRAAVEQLPVFDPRWLLTEAEFESPAPLLNESEKLLRFRELRRAILAGDTTTARRIRDASRN